MSDLEERIRRRAYHLWEEEGCPEGRELVHWDMAAALVAIEDNQHLIRKPVNQSLQDPEISADEIEPIGPVSTLGELPTITDQAEQVYPPERVPNKPEPFRRATLALRVTRIARHRPYASETKVPVSDQTGDLPTVRRSSNRRSGLEVTSYS